MHSPNDRGFVAAHTCPSCEAVGVTWRDTPEEVWYLDPNKQQRTLTVVVPTGTCPNKDCLFTFTDYRSEAIRDAAVKEALAKSSPE